MIAIKAQEYQDLEHESSSQLLEHDSRRVLGRLEEAAYHALQAGRNRTKMGQHCFEAQEYAEAAEDWLSAVECFLLATARKQAAVVFDLLIRLEVDGKIPVERPDLVAALRNSNQRLRDVEQGIQAFLRDFALHGYQVDTPDERALRFLQEQVRHLPGFAILHYAIFRQAEGLGQRELGAKHLFWAATFDPENANLVALLGYQHLAIGRSDLAISLGLDFLTAHSSDAGPVRIMLAHAFARGAEAKQANHERAVELLNPLIEDTATDVSERIAALAVSATLQYELGREQEFARLVGELDRLGQSVSNPAARDAIAVFRGLMPHAQRNGAGELDPRLQLLPEEERRRLFEKAMQVSVPPIPLAA
jgi:hypothetical protein